MLSKSNVYPLHSAKWKNKKTPPVLSRIYEGSKNHRATSMLYMVSTVQFILFCTR